MSGISHGTLVIVAEISVQKRNICLVSRSLLLVFVASVRQVVLASIFSLYMVLNRESVRGKD